jgi:hypothetical protein
MDDGLLELEATYTLLCVRADGIASVVDLVTSHDMRTVRRRAEALLAEHRSCAQVEVWRDGALLEQLTRG